MSFDAPLRLCHLPLVMDVFRRTGMADVIDHAVKQDPRSEVSAAECVAVILSGVYIGAHSLWRLRERLEPYDMKTVMQDPTFDLERFPEERLAKMLDDVYLANPEKLMTAISIQMIEAFALDTSFLHFDTTSLSFYGAYEREDPFSAMAGIDGPPVVTFGHSKINRSDLKQLMFGLLVTNDGGVPLMGKALDGNASDSLAAAEFFSKIRGLVADPRKVCCVGDSKGWSPRTVSIIQEANMRLLSRLPRTKKLHARLMFDPRQPDGVLELPAKRPGKPADAYEYTGFDVDDEMTWFETDAAGKRHRRTMSVPTRAVRVHSSALLRTKLRTLDRLRKREDQDALRKMRDWQHCVYACEKDAIRAAKRNRERATWTTLDVSTSVHRHEGPVKRGRGRPRKVPEPELSQGIHWRVSYHLEPISDDEVAERLHESASFILVRTRNPGWKISDEDMIRRYKNQYRVEHGFAWLKSGAEINPAFIHTPHRLASLCFIYTLGLVIWNLIQRTVRKNLKTWKTGLPYHRNKPSDRITTRFLFELFPKVGTMGVTMPDGERQLHLVGFSKHNELACRALETTPAIFMPVQK